MTATQTEMTTAIGPVIIEAESSDGQTYAVPLNRSIVFSGGSAVPVTSWSAAIANPVVEFVPGHVYDSWTANPGFQPLAEGVTEITMTSKEPAASHTFTLQIRPPLDLTPLPASDQFIEGALPPVMIDPATAGGRTFIVSVGNVAVLNGPRSVPTPSWRAQIADPAVAEFVPGHVYDTWTANPGFRLLRSGTTEVTVSSPEYPGSCTFTLCAIAMERLAAAPDDAPLAGTAAASASNGSGASLQVPRWIAIEREDCSGKVYQLPAYRAAVFVDGGIAPVAWWRAEIQNPDVLEFVPGGSRLLGAFYSPSFRARQLGSTTVVMWLPMINGKWKFTIEVQADD